MNFNFLNTEKSLVLIREKLILWSEMSVKLIPNIIVAFVVMILFIALAKLAKMSLKVVLPKMVSNSSLNELVLKTISIMITLVGLFTALEILNLDKTVTSILAGAGVVGLALGFAFQEIASNFVSGIFIAIRKPYAVNDIVKVEDYLGTVRKIELRTTTIETFDGLHAIIPNKSMFTKSLTNYTLTPYRRVDVGVGVSYSDDLELVEKVVAEVLEGVDHRDNERGVEVYYNEFDSSSINLDARVWIRYPGEQNFLKIRSSIIKCIKKRFSQEGISIPFPIRTVHLKKPL